MTLIQISPDRRSFKCTYLTTLIEIMNDLELRMVCFRNCQFGCFDIFHAQDFNTKVISKHFSHNSSTYHIMTQKWMISYALPLQKNSPAPTSHYISAFPLPGASPMTF